MTLAFKKMNDFVDDHGHRWPVGTLRIFYNDSRKGWSVSTPGDDRRSDAFASWINHGGQIFDGRGWLPLVSGSEAVDAIMHRAGRF